MAINVWIGITWGNDSAMPFYLANCQIFMYESIGSLVGTLTTQGLVVRLYIVVDLILAR